MNLMFSKCSKGKDGDAQRKPEVTFQRTEQAILPTPRTERKKGEKN
jgi:hypothetical protein